MRVLFSASAVLGLGALLPSVFCATGVQIMVERNTEKCIGPINSKRISALPALSESAALAEKAINHLAGINDGKDKCSSTLSLSDSKYGQTYFTSNPTPNCEDAVESWFSQIHLFNGTYPGTNKVNGTEDFLQMMWEDTKEFGCAITKGCSPEVIACFYEPKAEIGTKAPFSESAWKSILSSGDASPFVGSISLAAAGAAVLACFAEGWV